MVKPWAIRFQTQNIKEKKHNPSPPLTISYDSQSQKTKTHLLTTHLTSLLSITLYIRLSFRSIPHQKPLSLQDS